MTKKKGKLLRQFAMLLFTGGLLWLAFRNFDSDDGTSKTELILSAWNESNKSFLILSGIMALLSHWIRAERWKLLLNPLGYHLKSTHSFYSVMVGYFVNLAIPRGGELSRCYNLYKLNGTPVDVSFGSVLSERIIDLFFLLTLIGLVFIGEFDLLMDFFAQIPIDVAQRDYTMMAAGAIFVLIVVFFILRIIYKRVKSSLIDKVADFIDGIKSGVLSILKLEERALFIFYSFAIWVCYYLMNYLVMQAFPATESLDLIAALTIFIIGGIALAVPLPGGAGSYHTLVPLGLSLIYGIAKSDALVFAVIVHAWQTFIIILAGVLSLVISQFQINKSNDIGQNKND